MFQRSTLQTIANSCSRGDRTLSGIRTMVLALLVVAGVAVTCPAQDDQPNPETVTTAVTPPEKIDKAVARGAEIILERQESLEGKRGRSSARKKGPEWPYEGVYRVGGQIPIGYRIGGTSICASALLEVPGWEESEPRQDAVEDALDFVLSALRDKRMGHGFEVGYDVRGWGHTYALLFLLRLEQLERVPSNRRTTVTKTIKSLVDKLERGEIKEYGGWNYSRRKGRDGRIAASTFITASSSGTMTASRSPGVSNADCAGVEKSKPAK